MATNLPTYASTSDLRDIFPGIDKYDTKSTIYGWRNVVGHLFIAENCGLVNRLFLNGIDKGPPEASAGDVDSEGEWFYDSTADSIIYYTETYTTATIIDQLLEAGEDWASHKNDILYKASRYFDSYVDSNLPRNSWKNSEGSYDYVVIRTTAQIAAYFLISAHDPNNENALSIKGEFVEILEKINNGNIKLGFQQSQDSSQGTIREITSTGTLKPVDLRGEYIGDIYDKIRVQVTTAGVIGTATYSVWVSGNDTLGINKGQQVVTDEKIDGGYQFLTSGLYIRFGATTTTGTAGSETNLMTAAAVLNDVWEIEVYRKGTDYQDKSNTKSIEAIRR